MASITTVIPTYQRSQFLKNAIRSALNQTYEDLIVLVCDNVSTDETREVVRAFMEKDARVRYYCQPSHVSMNENFETGLSLVTTPYYSILSDDDLLFPWFYEMAVPALEREKTAEMFCGGTVVFQENGAIVRKAQTSYDGLWNIQTSSKEQMIRVIGNIVIQACVFRRGKHEKTTSILLKGGWDETMTWNVVLHDSIVFSSRFMVGYRKHSSQYTMQNVEVDVLNEDKIENLLEHMNAEIRSKVRYTDKRKSRWRFCLTKILQGNHEVAMQTSNLISRYNRPLGLMFYVLNRVLTVRLILYPLQGIYSVYKKCKSLLSYCRKKCLSRNEFSEFFNEYSG